MHHHRTQPLGGGSNLVQPPNMTFPEGDHFGIDLVERGRWTVLGVERREDMMLDPIGTVLNVRGNGHGHTTGGSVHYVKDATRFSGHCALLPGATTARSVLNSTAMSPKRDQFST